MPRRLAITSPFHAQIVEYQDRPLQSKEVLVKTEWASGKHGTTLGQFSGRSFAGQRYDLEMRLFVESEGQQPPLPGGTGTSGVGTVVAVGPEVTRWKVGDRVFGLMDIRETNICREERLWELGDIDPTLALCIEPALVAFHCIRESQVRYGDSVAVIGLGALGLLTVRMAAQAGAEAIFAIDPLPNRREWAARHGASQVLDPSEGDAALKIHQLTGGKGVDVAIELSGAYAALQTAIRCARVAGTVCSAGFYQGESYGLWLGREWHHNRLTMIVPFGCGWMNVPRDYPRWDEQRAYDAIASLMRQGKLSAPGLIQPIFSLDEAPDIYELMRDEPEKAIKFGVKF
jgi:threonine dehydrogenase-like Zn-dependent dehydrogenase